MRKISKVSIDKIRSLSDFALHASKSAEQRRMLVSINRAANKRLEKITRDLNKGKISKSILQERPELKNKIHEVNGVYKMDRYTAARNMTKQQMESQITERLKFLDSPFSKTSEIKSVEAQRRKALRDLYNSSMGYDKDDPRYVKRFKKEFYDDFGKLLNRLRDEHKLDYHGEDEYYLQEMEQIVKVVSENPEMSVDDWFDSIIYGIEDAEVKKAAEKQAEERSMLFGG